LISIVPIAPLTFWGAYGIPILAGVGLLLIAVVAVLGVLFWHRRGGDQTPLLEQGPIVAKNYHLHSPAHSTRTLATTTATGAYGSTPTSSLSSSSSSSSSGSSSRAGGRMLRPSGTGSALSSISTGTIAEQRGLLEVDDDDEVSAASSRQGSSAV
jgi:hypothetical protein